MRGQEIIVFPRHPNLVAAGVDTAWRDGSYRTSTTSYAQAMRGYEDEAIFIPNIPPDTTQGELSAALVQFGKYEQMAMRMFPLLFPHSSLLSGIVIIRPRFKIRAFCVLERRLHRGDIACSPAGFYYRPGAKPTKRTHREPPIQLVPWGPGVLSAVREAA